MRRYFQLSCHALVASAFLALGLTGRLDAPSIILFTLGFAASLYRAARGLRPLLSARGAFYLSCGYIGFFAFDTIALSRSFIPATIHLVLFLELAKMHQRKKTRDYFYLIILAFLKVLAASSLTIDISFAMTLLLFLAAMVSTLMSFEMYRSERKSATDSAKMGLSVGGVSVFGTILIVALAGALFFLIPRVGTGYFSPRDMPAVLLSGFTDDVQLGEIGQVKLGGAVVMHARRMSGAPGAVQRWRGVALDTFDGKNWFRRDRERVRLRGPRQPAGEAVDEMTYTLGPSENDGEQVRYEFLLEPLATTVLFAPYRPNTISGRVPAIEVDSDGAIYRRFQTQQRLRYETVSEVPYVPRLVDGAEPAIPPDIRARYLQLPDDLDPRVSQLAKQIAPPESSVLEKARRMDAYLKNNYSYTLALDWAPGPQPLATFLLSAKRGHCEYFASSMAILLRADGVPTRIVNGFLMGEYNPVSESYLIRQSDAHSWVEVYIPGAGWREFDPTPSGPLRGAPTFGAQIYQYVDAMQLYWNSYILVYDSGSQFELFRSAQDWAQAFQHGVEGQSESWAEKGRVFTERFAARVRPMLSSPPVWVLAALIVAAGLVFRYRQVLRTELRLRSLRKGQGSPDADAIAQLFYRAARIATDKGPGRAPGQTWREWSITLSDERKPLMAGATSIFEKSKYGGEPPSLSDFASLDEIIRRLRTRSV